MNELNDVTLNNPSTNNGIFNNPIISDGYITATSLDISSITIKDDTLFTFDGIYTYTGKDLKELFEMKDLIKQLLEKEFPQNFI